MREDADGLTILGRLERLPDEDEVRRVLLPVLRQVRQRTATGSGPTHRAPTQPGMPGRAEAKPLLALFRNCVVRIESAGEVCGTGCWVAPGEVLTCGQIVRDRLGLSVVWPGGSSPATVVFGPTSDTDDGAHSPQASRHLCLLRL